MPDRFDEHERQDRENDYRRGQRDASVDAKLADYDRRFEEATRTMERLSNAVNHLEDSLQLLAKNQEKRDAVQSALAESLEKAASKTISARTFILSLLGFLVAFAAMLFGALSATGALG